MQVLDEVGHVGLEEAFISMHSVTSEQTFSGLYVFRNKLYDLSFSFGLGDGAVGDFVSEFSSFVLSVWAVAELGLAPFVHVFEDLGRLVDDEVWAFPNVGEIRVGDNDGDFEESVMANTARDPESGHFAVDPDEF